MRCELPSVSRCRKAAGLTRWVRHPVQTPSHGRADRTRNPGASSGAPGFFVLGRVRAWSRNSGWDAWRHCCRRSAPRARWRSLVRGECIRRAVQFLASQRAPPPGCRGARQRHAAAERFVVGVGRDLHHAPNPRAFQPRQRRGGDVGRRDLPLEATLNQ